MSDRFRIHANFMQRFGAFFIDAGLLFFIYTPFHFYNVTEAKSLTLFIIYQSIWFMYKPLCELLFGKTLGKAVLRIKVVHDNNSKLGFVSAFSRNVLFMLQSGLGFYFYSLFFINADLAHINDFRIFQFTFIEAFPLYNVLFYSVFAIILLDAIYLMFLGGVKEKALHDRWAKTAVVVVDN